MQKAQEFDFKPFFDLIVGMLFVLIIMVSAELVFQQYNPANDAQKEQQKEQNALFEKEVLGFMSDVVKIAKDNDLAVNLDVTNKSVQLATTPFLKSPQNVKILSDIIALRSKYALLTLNRFNIHVAVDDLKGQAANDVGEALINNAIYRNNQSLFDLKNPQQHQLISINKQTILQKEGSLTFKFDLSLNPNKGLKP